MNVYFNVSVRRVHQHFGRIGPHAAIAQDMQRATPTVPTQHQVHIAHAFASWNANNFFLASEGKRNVGVWNNKSIFATHKVKACPVKAHHETIHAGINGKSAALGHIGN